MKVVCIGLESSLSKLIENKVFKYNLTHKSKYELLVYRSMSEFVKSSSSVVDSVCLVDSECYVVRNLSLMFKSSAVYRLGRSCDKNYCEYELKSNCVDVSSLSVSRLEELLKV